MKTPLIYDTIKTADGKSRVVNPEETLAAREKQKLIKEWFRAWLFTGPERTERFVRVYSDTDNNLRPRLGSKGSGYSCHYQFSHSSRLCPGLVEVTEVPGPLFWPSTGRNDLSLCPCFCLFTLSSNRSLRELLLYDRRRGRLEIDLVLLDVRMKGMDGPRTLQLSGCRECVLVVDDEPAVRSVIGTVC